MSKRTYEALPGVDWVNGRRVPANREVRLSAGEAKFDLAQGRIRPKNDEKADPKPTGRTLPAPKPAQVDHPKA